VAEVTQHLQTLLEVLRIVMQRDVEADQQMLELTKLHLGQLARLLKGESIELEVIETTTRHPEGRIRVIRGLMDQ
jgi:hypothetical protein